MFRFRPGGLFAALVCVLVSGLTLVPPPPPAWKVIGWNDTGMHQVDPDYSVFSFHPLGNDIRAQVISPQGVLMTAPAGMSVTYEAVADGRGSQNRSSAAKSNFWSFVGGTYGATPAPDTGLAGAMMPGSSNTPRAMSFDPTTNAFRASGIPVTPFDDGGHLRPFPMMKLVLRDPAGAPLASTKVVLPVSDEFNCRVCHGSGIGIAQPTHGWAWDPNVDRDYRLNILRIHDELNSGSQAYAAALLAAGYAPAGLELTAAGGTAVRCAKCHASNAYPGSGMAGIMPLTAAIHSLHAYAPDPQFGVPLDFKSDRSACYRCHAGANTQSLRGVMGNHVSDYGTRDIQCQSCHGSILAVGAPTRQGWLDEPTCQNCHTGTAMNNNGGIRYSSAFDVNGALRPAADPRFATTPDVPSPGHSLYRYSTGHGGLSCEACHGPAHAEVASSQANDNVQNVALQGHGGKLAECTACHDTQPVTVNGGPHGMHPIGGSWIDGHENVGSAALAGCRDCHGSDYRGTVLSRMQKTRTFQTDFGTVTFAAGSQIGCYSCHQGPQNENANPNHRPVVQNATGVSQLGNSVTVPLSVTDQDNDPLNLRVVTQPAHGRVSFSGTDAIYEPDPGFAGSDAFTYLAWDGSIDSNLGSVTITRGGEWSLYGDGVPGSTYQAPVIYLSSTPTIGSTSNIFVENSSYMPSTAFLIFSSEKAAIAPGYGGRLLCEPEFVVPVPLPAFGLTLQWAIPNLQSLIGVTIYGQVIEVDPGAHFGFSATRGLRVTIGP